jgi:hypothetical protein
LNELGYVDGQNIEIVYRYAEGDLTQLPKLADELVRLKPNVIVCETTPATLAIRQATATIAIVNWSLTDPEGFGFIASIARPGGQVIGISGTVDSLPGNQLQLVTSRERQGKRAPARLSALALRHDCLRVYAIQQLQSAFAAKISFWSLTWARWSGSVSYRTSYGRVVPAISPSANDPNRKSPRTLSREPATNSRRPNEKPEFA